MQTATSTQSLCLTNKLPLNVVASHSKLNMCPSVSVCIPVSAVSNVDKQVLDRERERESEEEGKVSELV